MPKGIKLLLKSKRSKSVSKGSAQRRTLKPPGYWKDFANLEHELLAFITEAGMLGKMPTSIVLTKAKRSDLIEAIGKHGGFPIVAERLGLLSFRKPNYYWSDFENLARELLRFVAEHGKSGTMPSVDELKKAGRTDILNAINEHGGFVSVAERLNLDRQTTRRQNSYWDNFANFERELRAFIEEIGIPGRMPTVDEINQAKRNDLAHAIRRYGGFLVVAQRLELTRPDAAKPAGYWNDFANLEHELLNFIIEHGTPSMMPTAGELTRSNRNDVVIAIRKHGGFPEVAKRLELARKNTNKAKVTGSILQTSSANY